MNKTKTALTLAIEKTIVQGIDETTDYSCGYDDAMKEMREYIIALLPKEREDMEKVFEDCRRSTKIQYTSCGDPMMCGCMGSCERPVAYIPKVFADKEAKEYFNQSFTQYQP